MSGGRLEPEYDPRLVEAALLVAVMGHRAEREFRAERDRLYEMAEPEARERAFVALHARWFERFALGGPVREALAARPELAAACARCLVAPARGARDEAADLLVAPPARPVLVVRVTAETVAAPD
ncbi:MAG: hypothetical protein HYS77_01015, partial [Candidatus Rokubacteria bacterium]|nr:hypothetical protein [Candidatus Rokubacteria bacterium]